MNIVQGVLVGSAGLVLGIGLTAGINSLKPLMQSQVSGSQPISSPVASPVASPIAPQKTTVDRLETKNFVFQNVKIARYTGEVSSSVDVAGELYQVTATITNRSNETLMPSSLSGVTYKLRDDQNRQYKQADFSIGLMDDGLKSTDGILPGQTREMIVGVFDVLPGVNGLELGVSDGMFADTKFVGPSQPGQASSPVAPAAAPAAVQVAAVTTSAPAPQPIAFESLTPCDQLDAVAKSGKSVSEFLVASAKVNSWGKYKAAIESTCPWNNEQLQLADRVLNPPVVRVTTRVQSVTTGGGGGASSGGSSSGGSSSGGSSWEPSPAWNNCNGIQEPGESYSARCETAQEMNDAGRGNRWSEGVDNRPLWMPEPGAIDPGFSRPPSGRIGESNGYSAN